jgi:hypothetical protein
MVELIVTTKNAAKPLIWTDIPSVGYDMAPCVI